MYGFHYSALRATCPDEGGKQTSKDMQSSPQNRLHSIQLIQLTRIDGQQTTDQTQWICTSCSYLPHWMPVCWETSNQQLDWWLIIVWMADVTHRHFHHRTFLRRKVPQSPADSGRSERPSSRYGRVLATEGTDGTTAAKADHCDL